MPEPVFIAAFPTLAQAEAFAFGLSYAGLAPLRAFSVVEWRDRYSPTGRFYQVHGPPEAQPARTPPLLTDGASP
jgi:hypothetical protein